MNSRPCTYCSDPDADVCVRTRPAPDSADVFAHDRCARRHDDQVLYRVVEPEVSR